jgi:hypothetical protein
VHFAQGGRKGIPPHSTHLQEPSQYNHRTISTTQHHNTITTTKTHTNTQHATHNTTRNTSTTIHKNTCKHITQPQKTQSQHHNTQRAQHAMHYASTHSTNRASHQKPNDCNKPNNLWLCKILPHTTHICFLHFALITHMNENIIVFIWDFLWVW